MYVKKNKLNKNCDFSFFGDHIIILTKLILSNIANAGTAFFFFSFSFLSVLLSLFFSLFTCNAIFLATETFLKLPNIS